MKGAEMNRLQYFWNVIRQGVPCLFHLLTGLYCPGCGGTRAVWYLLHGQILKSIQYHPLVVYAVLVVAIEFGSRCFTKITGRSAGKTDRPAMHSELPMRRYQIEVLIGAGIVLINWIFKNYMLVFRGVDLLSEQLSAFY